MIRTTKSVTVLTTEAYVSPSRDLPVLFVRGHNFSVVWLTTGRLDSPV